MIGWLRFGLLLACAGCSVLISVEQLGNGVCGKGQKACNESCVNADNPGFGCALESCAPCAIANAVSICSSAGQCAIAICRGAFEDCDHQVENGCEIDLDHDPDHCGACTGAVCVLPNAEPICANKRCAVRVCNAGWGDCNGVARDGCETDLNSSVAHCGRCEISCTANQTCVTGLCR